MRCTAAIPFHGFYESIHDAQVEMVLEQAFENETLLQYAYDAADWNNLRQQYAAAYAAAFCERHAIRATFSELWSPREYNFHTDRIFIALPRKEARRIFTVTDKGALSRVAVELFASRSGFTSFYDSDWQNWGYVDKWDANQLCALIAAHVEEEEDINEDWLKIPAQLYRVRDYLNERASR